jgi:tol-pal system protein YbgF
MKPRLLILGLLLAAQPGLSVAAAPASAALSQEQRLQRLERRVEAITELTLSLQALREENSRLRGDIETLQHQLAQLKRRQRDIYQDVDQRISALQQARTTGGAAPAQAGPSGDKPAGAAGPVGGDTAAGGQPPASGDPRQMQADYKAAYALLSPQVRRYDEAATAFEHFLKHYPDSPLAANAQYWLGESYYVAQKNKLALAAFQRLVEAYPDSPKVPGALYKIGRIQAAAGDRAKAIETLKRVLARYPEAPAAGLARAQLKKLQGAH